MKPNLIFGDKIKLSKIIIILNYQNLICSEYNLFVFQVTHFLDHRILIDLILKITLLIMSALNIESLLNQLIYLML